MKNCWYNNYGPPQRRPQQTRKFNAAVAIAAMTAACTLLPSNKLTHDPQIHPQPLNRPTTNNNKHAVRSRTTATLLPSHKSTHKGTTETTFTNGGFTARGEEKFLITTNTVNKYEILVFEM